MLKRSLITLIIMIVGFVMVSSALGQNRPPNERPSKKNPKIKRPVIKPIVVEREEILIDGLKADGDVIKVTGGRSDSETSRTRKTRNRSTRTNKKPTAVPKARKPTM